MPTPFAPAIVDAPLPYVAQLDPRSLAQVDLVVIHCTELPDLAAAREYGERVLYDSGTGNSGHYYIDRDGTVLRYVPDDRIAHHVRGMNRRAIGIELVNTGRFPHWLDSRHQAFQRRRTQHGSPREQRVRVYLALHGDGVIVAGGSAA